MQNPLSPVLQYACEARSACGILLDPDLLLLHAAGTAAAAAAATAPPRRGPRASKQKLTFTCYVSVVPRRLRDGQASGSHGTRVHH
jgi:hypothetical protein